MLPIVEETPPFLRALTFASLDMPGPYEKVAKEAFFNVTLPEKSWTPTAVAEHMAAFNHGVIISTAVHETYPGHYLQGMWLDKAPSKARKLVGANTYIEGWAHYCEQMMLDEGYGNGDLTLRLGQLQDALLRNARYIVGIQMHTGKMTYEQGVDFFVKEGFQTRTNGERETKRGTSDPIYLQVLHARQAGDSQTPRGLQEAAWSGVHDGGIPQQIPQPGQPADQNRPPRNARQRFTCSLAFPGSAPVCRIDRKNHLGRQFGHGFEGFAAGLQSPWS